MAEIPFTQFMRPDGRRVPVRIDRPAKIASKAFAIIERGYRFEVEHLITGQASLTVADDDGDQDIEVVENGPEVPIAVDRMISRFASKLLGTS